MNKKYLGRVLIIISAIILTACGKYNNDVDEENPFRVQEYDYNYGFSSVCNDNGNNSIDITYDVKNEGSEITSSLMIFVNGIPQKFNDDKESSYLNIEQTADNKSYTYKFTPEVADNYESLNVRSASMLLPDKILTKDPNYVIGHRHSIMQTNARQLEYSGNVTIINVSDKQGKQLNDTANKTRVATYVNGNSYNYALIHRKDLLGTYTIEIAEDTKTDYIASFWGDGDLIEIEGNKYHRISVGEGETVEFDFEIKEYDISSVSNFYVILCPESNTQKSILKLPTLILSDEPVNRGESTTEGTITEPPSTENNYLGDEIYGVPIALFNNIVYEYSYTGGNNGGITIIGRDITSGKTTYKYGPVETLMFPYINASEDGIIIRFMPNEVLILNSKLEKIWHGNKNEYFKDYEQINISNSKIICGRIYEEMIVYGDSEETFTCNIVSKDINTGDERTEWTLECTNLLVSDVHYVSEQYYICSGVIGDIECTIICDRKEKKDIILENMVYSDISENGSKIMLKEQVGGHDEDKPYVFIYDVPNENMTKIVLSSGAETDLACLSSDGEYILTQTKGQENIEINCITISDNLRRRLFEDEVLNGFSVMYEDKNFAYACCYTDKGCEFIKCALDMN